ncbi:C4-dicarboxylate ABC transporter substrate-binding protein [Virgisporangium aliadipatigenens]|uniref:C4-dicarboxylate ABC transporter substrate-binding protein n=1 Tax=Virgisporangium aliadipatigenens TaxID=741659 RepID=A0A8J4DQ36_9ACTN|nr:tripartite tricarboxylate transporter substrate binding protein [Virgisporangium aliadipatigenens]GIJ46179.1 C4-dicarboxylate ABC transporter substrate-binding protein [Virgisporangium aliadipatigenens]
MPVRRLSAVAALLAVAAVLLLAIDRGRDPLAGLRVMVPNAPGSGYDVTARTLAKALEDAGLVRGVEVFNLPGAGGSVGVQRLVYERGRGSLLMLMGLGVVASEHSGATAALRETTPIARLIQEPNMIVVTRDAPFRTLSDLVTAWREAPASVPVGGGSLPGGPDHLAPMLLARAIGVAPPTVRYERYDGGGELLAAILGKRVAFGVSGVGEYADQVRTGTLRVLAVTGPARVPGLDAPTLREAGVDLEFANWRGIIAPPGLHAEDARALRELVDRLVRSAQWRAALARNGWSDAYLGGPAFDRFLAQERARLDAVMSDLGLTAT